MPLLPIDLQTLFSQMNHVSREQSIQKEIPPQHQAVQGSEIAKNAEQKDNSVNETHEVGNGLEKIKEEKKSNERKENRDKTDSEKKKSLSGSDNDLFKDPNLGHHVDIVR